MAQALATLAHCYKVPTHERASRLPLPQKTNLTSLTSGPHAATVKSKSEDALSLLLRWLLPPGNSPPPDTTAVTPLVLPSVRAQRLLLTRSPYLNSPRAVASFPTRPDPTHLPRAPGLTSPRACCACLSGAVFSPPTMASRAVLLLCASVVFAVAACSEARDFMVGGASDGWKVPAQPDALSKWASANRFHVGDNLVFKFDGAADSVLEVSQDDYNRCSTATPLATHKASAGVATVPLPRSGPYYFVSGAPGSCAKGQRLLLLVMSEKHGRSHQRAFFAPVPAPALAPAQSPLATGLVEGPAAAPAPLTGAAGRTSAAARSRALLLLGAAVLGAVLVVGW